MFSLTVKLVYARNTHIIMLFLVAPNQTVFLMKPSILDMTDDSWAKYWLATYSPTKEFNREVFPAPLQDKNIFCRTQFYLAGKKTGKCFSKRLGGEETSFAED
jgi:hypothetical protein